MQDAIESYAQLKAYITDEVATLRDTIRLYVIESVVNIQLNGSLSMLDMLGS